MLDQNLGCLLECILRKDGTVGSDFENKFLVVSFLSYAIVLDIELDVDDRSVNGVNCNGVNILILLFILIGTNITTTFIDSEGHVELNVLVHVADDEIGVEDFKRVHDFVEVTCDDLVLTSDVEINDLTVYANSSLLKADLLEVKDNLSNIVDYTRDCSELMLNAVNLDRRDGETFE